MKLREKSAKAFQSLSALTGLQVLNLSGQAGSKTPCWCCLFLMHATGNEMGVFGANALVRSLPFLTGLQTLLLHGDYFSMWRLS